MYTQMNMEDTSPTIHNCFIQLLLSYIFIVFWNFKEKMKIKYNMISQSYENFISIMKKHVLFRKIHVFVPKQNFISRQRQHITKRVNTCLIRLLYRTYHFLNVSYIYIVLYHHFFSLYMLFFCFIFGIIVMLKW